MEVAENIVNTHFIVPGSEVAHTLNSFIICRFVLLLLTTSYMTLK